MREHGERSDLDDAVTAPTRRPRIAPTVVPPDYGRRRVVLGVAVLCVVGLGIGIGLAVTGGGDDATAPSDSLVLTRPAVADDFVPDASATAVPKHHGYHPDVLYVALYGSVGTDRLGVLGEADVVGSVDRAAEVAADYESFGPTVVPTFEIIASVASYDAGDDGDYSNEAAHASLWPWIDAADDAGYHVVLDLQSGRQRFPSQITEFEELLLEPHVSVALDPEWRVGPTEVPEGGKIGTVSGAEVNTTVEFLDRLVVANDLPPKMLIVHQFDSGMISDRDIIRGTDNVQIVIHMDGFGTLDLKRETYAWVASDLPPGAVVGWKNFYDEDQPTPTPQQTMDNDPIPMFVSFQ